MKRRRVKITGIGPVTPAGIGREEFWKGILEPVSRVRPMKSFERYGDGVFVAAQVSGFDLADHVPAVNPKRMPRHTQFALAGAALALRDAGLEFGDLRDKAALVIAGASLMDFGAINKGVEMIVKRGMATGIPSSVFSASVSAIAGTIAEQIGGSTRTLAVQSACCAGSDAIGHAADMVASGETEIAICGGTEAPLYFHPMLELKLAGLAPATYDRATDIGRPFDLWRTTGVIGEGACMFVLEPEESPRRDRGFLAGYAYGTDPVETPGGGLELAIKLALANAGVRQSDVDCIFAWGPGHAIIDVAEAKMLWRVFGSQLSEIPALSIKGAIGNPLGAGGPIQLACAALGLRDDMIPPTVNWERPDPACPLNLSNQPRHVRFANAIVNSHGLSGTNSCLVITR